MITASELAAMQATVNTAFDVTVTQQRSTRTQGATGNVIDTYATINAALVCNLAQPGGQLLQNYDYKIGAEDSWLVRVAAGTDLREDDHLITSDGQALEVHILLTPQSYPTCIQALCAEVK